MALTPIPTVSALPDTPIRGVDVGDDFSGKMGLFLDALHDNLQPEINTTVGGINALLPTIETAAEAGWLQGTSTSSVTIGAGTKNFTVETGKHFFAGRWISIHDAAAPSTNYMIGQIASYDSGTGALSVIVNGDGFYGSGTKSNWVLYISGPKGSAGTLPSLTGNAGKVLAVNSGETAAEWTALGYKLIGTLSPSGASYTTFSSIPQTYSELFLDFELTLSSSQQMRLDVSPNGSTWGATVAGFGPSNTTLEGNITIPGYTMDRGPIMLGSFYGSDPYVGSTGAANWKFTCTGGIHALRIYAAASATHTGTATLYGRP